jgi:hypothetical protein
LSLTPELFSDRQTCQGNTGTSTWGLVHLAEDKGDLGLSIKLDDRGLLHFVVKIVALASTLTDTSEDRVTTVSLSNVVDEFLNEDSLADASTAEETNFAATGIRSNQIDNLDTGSENLSGGGLLDEFRGLGVNWQVLVGFDRTALVDRITSNVHDAAQSSIANRDGNWGTGVGDLGTTGKTLST